MEDKDTAESLMIKRLISDSQPLQGCGLTTKISEGISGTCRREERGKEGGNERERRMCVLNP